ILSNLEMTEADETGRPRLAHNTLPKGEERDMVQLDLFGSGDWKLKEWLRGLDIDAMTPLAALIELSKLKKTVNSNPSD
ncbi:MAG: hypothetical protein ISR62_08855, partial [Desulfobacteraceae bacterium]|nr:hypothetical protein [Desulfobacteraceae bacterium]